jgi:hypothetical protein
MQWKYFITFKAADVDAQMAIRERLLPIEGIAIDTSVNANKWQVPPEDLDFFVSSLQGSQLRIDHAESAMAVIGKVPQASRLGDAVQFRAEIGDLPIIEKVLRGYLTHVSVQVDSDDVQCSACGKPSRTEGMLTHLCPGAWEIVHKPRVRELSIVASPAYKNTEFKPLGFAAAMNDSQNCYQNADQVMQRVKVLIRKVWELKEDDQIARKVNLLSRISKLADDIPRLRKEEMEATRQNLIWRVAMLRRKIATLPRRTIRGEMVAALETKTSYIGMRLEKYCELASFVDCGGTYLDAPEVFQDLKRATMRQ